MLRVVLADARKACHYLIVQFTWDPRKADSNAAKHGVTFEEAETVFRDPMYLPAADQENPQAEARLMVIGMSARTRVLFVVSVEVEEDDVMRIVSARLAEPHERETYAEQFYKASQDPKAARRRAASARAAHRRAARRPRKSS